MAAESCGEGARALRSAQLIPLRLTPSLRSLYKPSEPLALEHQTIRFAVLSVADNLSLTSKS